MELAEQYINQIKWRRFEDMISKLPLSEKQTVLDLGCGPGVVTNLISPRVSKITGIDINTDLIDVARKNKRPNENYLVGDIKNLGELDVGMVDGIWSSFSSAYFVSFLPILKKWISHLNPNGWIAIIEISDLFTGHSPLSSDTQSHLKTFNDHLLNTEKYDVHMGMKLQNYMKRCGLRDINTFEFNDDELCFDGPASGEVVEAWTRRFTRLSAMVDVLSEYEYKNVQENFINCITSTDHRCDSKVIMCLGRK